MQRRLAFWLVSHQLTSWLVDMWQARKKHISKIEQELFSKLTTQWSPFCRLLNGSGPRLHQMILLLHSILNVTAEQIIIKIKTSF